ncbi:MAG: hypothetical protein DI586_04885 [Micavibrio aeruginosavorus]|uniref:Peptidase S74 domain-containing protein n=1 Tax=Micavibrio aeruginosavorus TaxID=349221 RepID=A0A2W5FQG8_9BACT|nr:MAG: hypothetical protein DI586_04885 [Micavibrio aeruginosavorus]
MDNILTDTRRPETVSSGNALFAVFGAVALVGLLGASVNTFVRGPLTSAVKQTRTNMAKSQMQIAGQAAVMASSTGVLSTEHAKVFLTSTQHRAGALGSLSGGDAVCQSRSSAAGLSGTYKAWLSDITTSAASRFNQLTVPYRLINGTVIANNWADLIDGNLTAPINITEFGVVESVNRKPMTNTNADGTIYSTTAASTCNNLTDQTSGYSFRWGNNTAGSSAWSNAGSNDCLAYGRLYCFQQDISTTAAANGDCDGDGVIEPLEWRAPGATPAPTGGGLLPAKIGINKKDPWGTEYGYCTWDYGSTTLNASCQQETPGTNLRLAGHATNRDTPVVAIISAGPDRKFTTTCRSFATADANSNGVLTDSDDLALVGKAASNDDDIIFTYTYEQARNATGGLWSLKSGAPGTATISKNVEAQEAKFSGAGLFAKLAAATGDFLDVVSGLRLGSPSVVSTCDAANTNALRRNQSSNAIEVCNGTAWVASVSFGGTGGNAIGQDVPPQTQNIVFVTSATYTGNLGGLSGADEICQKHANAAALPGKYMAWVADSSGSPSTRFYQSTVPYRLVDGTTTIANNWADLVDGGISSSISKNETGATVAGGGVWTNVASNGTVQGANSCSMWTEPTAAANSRQGTSNLITSSWTNNGNDTCPNAKRLYCFQQTEAATYTSGGSTAGTFDSLSDAVTDYANDLFYGGPGSGGTGNSSKVSWGYQNFTNSSSAYESVALGAQAGQVLNTGGNNALGYRALVNTTTGGENTVMGALAGSGMGANDYYNTGIGYNVLKGSGGINNVYVGASAGKAGTDNIGFGSSALDVNTGNQNVVLGYQAGLINDTGSNNTVAGSEAFRSNTSGSNNVAIGYQSLRLNRTSENTAAGQRSMATNVNGLRAVAIGAEASRYQLSDDNTAIGAGALKGVNNASTGINNTGVGYGALGANTTGVDNTALGYQALLLNSTGSYNTAAGYQALTANIAGSNNTAVGTEALLSLTGSSDNTAFGSQSLRSLTSSGGNTAIGYNAGRNITTTSGHTIIGSQAQGNGNPSGPVTAVGHYALYNNIGSGNTAVGTYSLLQISNGSNNTAVGYNAGAGGGIKNTSNMTAIGSNSANSATGDNLTAVGYNTLRIASGINNTGMGYQALANLTTGINNTALGDEAGLNMTTASHNALAGYRAGYFNVTGDFVTAAGYQALLQNLAPANTALGFQALLGNSQGLYNTAIGYVAMQANTVGNFNTAIGSESLLALNGTYTAASCAGLGSTRVTDPNTGHCYYRLSSTQTWANAQTACQANGDYLAVVSTAAENSLILSIGSGNSWLGAKDDAVEGVWRWIGKTATSGGGGSPQTELKVFVTDVNTSGDLGGLSGADATCQSKAAAAGLTGTFKAWLADGTASPDTRFSKGTVPYKLVDGTVLANNWADLTDGTLAAGVGKDQNNSNIYTGAWTNVASNGTAYGTNHCQNWTSSSASFSGRIGISGNLTNWTSDSDFACQNVARFYCFEQMNTGSGGAGGSGTDLSGIQFWQGAVAGSNSNDLYTKWSINEPSNAGGVQHCLFSSTALQAWDDGNCTSTYSGICEKEPTYTSSYNTAVGMHSLRNTADGNRNTAVGYQALMRNVTGSDNTAVGYQALYNNQTGSQNTAVGYGAGPLVANLSNTTSIGNGAEVTLSNTIRVGNTAVTAITGQVAFAAPSDARLKKDIASSDLGLDFIMGLKPVSYRLKQGNGRLDYGFLAQDIEASLDGRVTNMITRRNDEMKTYQLRSADLIAPLVKALQEQDATIERLQAKIDAIKAARNTKACTKENAEGRYE